MMSANKNHAALCPRVPAATPTIIDNITHEKTMDGAILSPFVGPSRPTFQRGRQASVGEAFQPSATQTRFLVALPPAPDLLLFAKHLFVGAMVVAIALLGAQA